MNKKHEVLKRYIEKYIKNPKVVDDWYLYRVHHIDELDFFEDAMEFLVSYPEAFDLLAAIRDKMRADWWEGDGRLQWAWLPPFCFEGHVWTVGAIIWHIKQRNNGTSFIVTPHKLHALGIQANGKDIHTP